MRTLLRLVVGAVATASAVWLIPGIRVVAATDQQYVLILLGVAAIMGVVNAVVKPFTQALSFCHAVTDRLGSPKTRHRLLRRRILAGAVGEHRHKCRELPAGQRPWHRKKLMTPHWAPGTDVQ